MPSIKAVRGEQELRRVFESAGGYEGDGLSASEFPGALEMLGLPYDSIAYLTELRTTADVDMSGIVSYEEFKALFSLGCLRHVFDEIDADHSGFLQLEELAEALSLLGVHIPAHQIQTLLNKVDTNSDGKISFEEFSSFFSMIPKADLRSVFNAWTHQAGIDIGIDIPALPPTNMPLWRFLCAGGVAGCASRTLTAPLEKLKIQAQVTGKSSGSLLSLAKTLTSGTIRTAWQGNLTNCLRIFPYSGLVCVFYSQILKALPADNEMDALEPVWRALGGGIAGAAATTLTYPLDVIRAKLTVATTDSTHGIMSTAREVVAKSGIRGLWGGLSATLLAVAPFVGLQQASYDVMKMVLIDKGLASPSVGFFTSCGVASGLFAQTLVYPLDVLRRRIQVEGVESAWARLYTLPALRRVVQKEGMRGLYAGLGATYMKVAPAVATSLVVRDAMLGRLDDAILSRDERQ